LGVTARVSRILQGSLTANGVCGDARGTDKKKRVFVAARRWMYSAARQRRSRKAGLIVLQKRRQQGLRGHVEGAVVLNETRFGLLIETSAMFGRAGKIRNMNASERIVRFMVVRLDAFQLTRQVQPIIPRRVTDASQDPGFAPFDRMNPWPLASFTA
jgi:hypothetical protein